ncbi:MAG: TolC family protein [Salibacteraceae bacterium]
MLITAEAQEPKAFTLEEAVEYGVKNNYQLQQAKMDIDISQNKVRETTALGLPQVNAEASYNNYIDIPVQVAPAFDLGIPGIPAPDPNDLQEFQFGLPHTLSGGITASQLLFDGSYIVGLKTAKQYLNYSLLGAEKTESEVKTSIAKTYINAVAAKENIKALEENKTNIEKIYAETNSFFEVGFLEKQDADQVRLLRSNISYQLDFANRQLESIMNLLKYQMGVPVSDPITITDDINSLIDQGSEQALSLMDQPFTVNDHIDFRTVEQGERLSELSLSNTRAGYYPQLSAFFTHSQNSFSNELGDIFDTFYPTTLWGLQMKVPIFSSGMRYTQAKQAKLELEKTRSQKTMLEQSLTMQAINAASTYRSALERYEVVNEDLELAKSIKETTRKKFNAGLASSNDLTQAESQYLTTLGNYINTTIELLNAKLDLVTAYGK